MREEKGRYLQIPFWEGLSKDYSIKAPASAVHDRFGQPTRKALNLNEGFVEHEWLIGTFHGKSNVLVSGYCEASSLLRTLSWPWGYVAGEDYGNV